MIFLEAHSLIMLIDVPTRKYSIFDTFNNPNHRKTVKETVRKAIGSRLGYAIHLSQEVNTTFLPHGCSLTLCSLAYLFTQNQRLDLLQVYSKPTPKQNKEQWKIFQNVKKMVAKVNPTK